MAASAITNTDWPTTPIPEPVKQLLNRFFTLVDTKSADMGLRLSEDVFAEKSDFIGNKTMYKGRAEIKTSRDRSWDGITSRRHEIQKVYACDDKADDLILIGFVEIGYNNGMKVDGSFVVRAIIDDPNSQSPRLELYQGWMDPTEMAEAKKQQA